MGKNKFSHFCPSLEKFWKNSLVLPWKNPSNTHACIILSTLIEVIIRLLRRGSAVVTVELAWQVRCQSQALPLRGSGIHAADHQLDVFNVSVIDPWPIVWRRVLRWRLSSILWDRCINSRRIPLKSTAKFPHFKAFILQLPQKTRNEQTCQRFSQSESADVYATTVLKR